MASEPLNDEALCDSEVEPEETVLVKDFPVKSNQSYYNSQKLYRINSNRLYRCWRPRDCITTHQLCYPKEAKSFTKVKQCLHERFHGGDNRKMYLIEYNNCTRNPGESIRDYACRIQKLYSFAYPTKAGKSLDLEMRISRIDDNGQIFRRAQIKSPGTYEFQGI
ncbi:hypothetical protein DAPPUDRAFT_118407 [Daphnia pulex]|uniref:Retrotransposon gag domain-containing protein n=1 Tax=Daphnia pulex TaxID=6669 RepID=E9HVM2_DAPPU|nr:hypothetical protein DAPPUDRAFT_118407 [Daphnia pulex]|eukprot:EFX64209.1 hypothetical protein DAPPUDRAFT_118407 [Daphnia pulex]